VAGLSFTRSRAPVASSWALKALPGERATGMQIRSDRHDAGTAHHDATIPPMPDAAQSASAGKIETQRTYRDR
jgi:hypothetical protein